VTRRPRVLLAEDHPAVAKAVCRVLALDCEVVEPLQTAAQCWKQRNDSCPT
jgi:DNA-binding NarL/FixJ family response regulator